MIYRSVSEEFFKIWTGVLILLITNETCKRGKQTKGLFERFFNLLLSQKGLLIQVFLPSLIYAVLGIVGAFYMKELLDSILPYGLI